jgi:hypothetical protein
MAKFPKKPSILSKIAGTFRRGSARPTRPHIAGRPSPGGHMGIHMTSRRLREEREKQGLPRYTAAEKQKWQEASGDIVDAFVYMNQYVPVHSSNVAAAQYDINKTTMTVWFHGKVNRFGEGKISKYKYFAVTEQEAKDFMYYLSKGSFIWSVFRVRGTKYGHRKAYRRVS